MSAHAFWMLQYLASLGFAHSRSKHVMWFVQSLTAPIYSNNVFAFQYSKKAYSLCLCLCLSDCLSVSVCLSLYRPYPILENKRLIKSVLMIQSYTWFADGNECITGEHNCDANADCNNTEGSFECTCKPGYSGNGVDCTGNYIVVKTWIVLMLRLFQYHSSSCFWVSSPSIRDISKCINKSLN